MESFSTETLTILVLIAVILSGVTFITLAIVVICLLCSRKRPSDAVSPAPIRSIEPSISSVSRSSSSSSSVTPIQIRPPAVNSTKREVKSTRPHQSPSDTISIIEEQSYNNQKKRHQLYKHDTNDVTPTRNESRGHPQSSQPNRQQQQKLSNLMADGRFLDRHTPYPPDVLARERVMMNHLRIPTDY